MNKFISIALASAVSSALLVHPLSAQDDNIVVTPGLSQAAFVDRISNDLNRQLVQADKFNEPIKDGIVIVRFTRSEEGEAQDIHLYRKSGRTGLDRLARKAVARLETLDALPSGVERDQLYQANIIFASTEAGARRLKGKLAEEEAVRMAANNDRAMVIAIGNRATSRPAS